MPEDGHIPLARFFRLERTKPSAPPIRQLESSVARALEELSLPAESLRSRRIAVTVGSRGVANIAEVTRAACAWLRSRGAEPLVIPAMGSHGGATAEGQRKILEDYGVVPGSVGCEVRSSMETVSLGPTPEGYQVFMSRTAWEAHGVLVLNRVKPHTGFSGNVESGLLKMMAVGLGKAEGAREFHRWARQQGFEEVLRAMAAKVLSSGKILAGLAVIENEFHQVAELGAARANEILAREEEALVLARHLVPRLPFSRIQFLIVDELGKNISGTGMDTKVIGRGVALKPGEAPQISLIYARDLTAESRGNALGVGLADLMHERLYRKIDLEKTYVNVRTSMNPAVARLPIFFPSDREALDFALGSLGSPLPTDQRVVWIRKTQELGQIGVSEPLAHEAAEVTGWRLSDQATSARFDRCGNLSSIV